MFLKNIWPDKPFSALPGQQSTTDQPTSPRGSSETTNPTSPPTNVWFQRFLSVVGGTEAKEESGEKEVAEVFGIDKESDTESLDLESYGSRISLRELLAMSLEKEEEDEYASEIAKTVLVSNVPLHITATQIIKAASVSGGIKTLKFYPQGRMKSALVEFESQQGPPPRWARKKKIVELTEGITVEAATCCIRQLLAAELAREHQRADNAEGQLSQKNRELAELRERLEEAENGRLMAEIEGRRLQSWLNADLEAKKGMANKIKELESVHEEDQDTMRMLRIEARELKKELNLVKIQMLSLQAEQGLVNESMVGLLQQLEEMDRDGEEDIVQAKIETFQRKWNRRKREKAEKSVGPIFTYWREWAEKSRRTREEEELTMKFLMEERRQRELEAEKREYDCPICCCEYMITDMYTLDGCFHRFCFTCLGEYLKLKIIEGKVSHIKCPAPECSETISPAEVKHVVPKELYEKYEDFSLRSALDDMPDLRWCPKPGCSNAMIGDENNLMIICTNPDCKFSFCFKCKEQWHADATCEEYQKWKIENSEADAKYAEWVRANAKQCPKCQSFIEKNGGCNHMTCQKCAHQFCWLCMKEYTPQHFGKMPWSCKQFT